MRLNIVCLSALTGLLGLLACDEGVLVFPENRSYVHQIFATAAECEAFQEAGGMNCEQAADFCRDGSAIVIVTDIINPSRYRIDDDIVTLSFPQPSELSSALRFRLSSKEDTLYLLPHGTPWTRDPAANVYCD